MPEMCKVHCVLQHSPTLQDTGSIHYHPQSQFSERTPPSPHLPTQPQAGSLRSSSWTTLSRQLATVDWTRNSQPGLVTQTTSPGNLELDFKESHVEAGHLNGGHTNSRTPCEKGSSTMCMEEKKRIRRKGKEWRGCRARNRGQHFILGPSPSWRSLLVSLIWLVDICLILYFLNVCITKPCDQ